MKKEVTEWLKRHETGLESLVALIWWAVLLLLIRIEADIIEAMTLYPDRFTWFYELGAKGYQTFWAYGLVVGILMVFLTEWFAEVTRPYVVPRLRRLLKR